MECLEAGIFANGVLGAAITLTGEESVREATSLLCHLSLCTRAKPVIAASACLPFLVNLCSAPDVETARCALGAIANLAEDVEGTHQRIVFKADAVGPIAKLLRHKHLSVAREATRAMSNLLLSEFTHEVFIEEHGLLALFLTSRSTDNECQYNAATIYRRLAQNPDTHERIHNYPDPR